MQAKCLKLSSNTWIWGPNARWRLYYSIKKYGCNFISTVITGGCEFNKNKKDFDSNSTYSRQILIAGASSSTKSRKKRNKFSFRKCSSSSSLNINIPLTKDEANEIIWCNEQSITINKGVVVECQTNQLASNAPNEDQISVTDSTLEDGILFTVLDGHGGHLFGEDVKIRLPYYLHTALSNRSYDSGLVLSSTVNDILQKNNEIIDVNEEWMINLAQFLNKQKHDMSSGLPPFIYSPVRHLVGGAMPKDLHIKEHKKSGIQDAMKDAFLRLDSDMISELVRTSKENSLNAQTIGSALSGCCALAAYVLKDELFIANSGDCRAVLGSKVKGEWLAIQLTNDHTANSNPEELQRIISEHPIEESRSCIQYGRLLSRLAPLRALGDMQFKLSNDELREIFKTVPKYSPIQSSKTPPYLTAEPEVFHYKLEDSDKFIVLASDGLWDMLSNEEVVELVAAYMDGRKIDVLKEKAFLYGVPDYEDLISSDDAFIDTKEENAASFLIRFALGGYDPSYMCSMLSIPHPDVRLYRDDITLSVIFLNDKESTD